MYEVLTTMSVLMAPFTPFFSEYTYLSLRKCHSNVENENVAEDAFGRASSVHMLMIPPVDESRWVLLSTQGIIGVGLEAHNFLERRDIGLVILS